jgi:hypothetical protein
MKKGLLNRSPFFDNFYEGNVYTLKLTVSLKLNKLGARYSFQGY